MLVFSWYFLWSWAQELIRNWCLNKSFCQTRLSSNPYIIVLLVLWKTEQLNNFKTLLAFFLGTELQYNLWKGGLKPIKSNSALIFTYNLRGKMQTLPWIQTFYMRKTNRNHIIVIITVKTWDLGVREKKNLNFKGLLWKGLHFPK